MPPRVTASQEVLMAMTIRTRWIKRGALVIRMAERRVRRLAAMRTIVVGRRRILAPVPLTVVPLTVEEGRELQTHEVTLALPAPNAPSTTRTAARGGLTSSYTRSGWMGGDAFAVRYQPPRHDSGSSNGWLEESDDEE